MADALAIYDAVAARDGIDRGRIVAFGRSLGTAVAARVAAERPVAGVVLVSPYDSLAAIGRHHYPWLPVSLLLRHRFDALADARVNRMPLLAIVGEVGHDHSGRAIARAVRRVGGTEALAGRAARGPQRARRDRRFLGRDRAVPDGAGVAPVTLRGARGGRPSVACRVPHPNCATAPIEWRPDPDRHSAGRKPSIDRYRSPVS